MINIQLVSMVQCNGTQKLQVLAKNRMSLTMDWDR